MGETLPPPNTSNDASGPEKNPILFPSSSGSPCISNQNLLYHIGLFQFLKSEKLIFIVKIWHKPVDCVGNKDYETFSWLLPDL